MLLFSPELQTFIFNFSVITHFTSGRVQSTGYDVPIICPVSLISIVCPSLCSALDCKSHGLCEVYFPGVTVSVGFQLGSANGTDGRLESRRKGEIKASLILSLPQVKAPL